MGIPNHGQYQLEDIPILGLFNHELFNHELFNPGRLNHELMNHELFNHDLDFSIPFMLIIEELMVEKSGILSQGRRLGLKQAWLKCTKAMIAPKFVEVWFLVMK